MPSILGTMILLFGNSFGAQATAFQLTGGTIEIATIAIGRQIRGDVLHNPGLGYAMAMGMVVVMSIVITAYTWLQRRSERWLLRGWGPRISRGSRTMRREPATRRSWPSTRRW